MAYASLQSLGPLAPAAGPFGSRIQRRTQRPSVIQIRPALLQVRSMNDQEQWKPQSKGVTTTSRRDAILFMTAMSFGANTILSADAAEAQVKTAGFGQQIMESLKEMIGGLSKGTDTKDKEKAPVAKEKISIAKEKAPKPKEEKPQTPPLPPPPASEKEKIAQKEGENPKHHPSTKSKDETPKPPPNHLNDFSKP